MTNKINTEAKFLTAVEASPAQTRKLAVQVYTAIRSRSEADSKEAFDHAVGQYLAAAKLAPTPANCVHAAARVTFRCKRCAGTGNFITMVENGKPVGPGGECFRCGGKGVQNDDDARRNFTYDLHRPVYL